MTIGVDGKWRDLIPNTLLPGDTRIILHKLLICLDIHKAFWGTHGFVDDTTRHWFLI